MTSGERVYLALQRKPTILAVSHTVPPETPDGNTFAMYSEAGITKEEILDNTAYIGKSLRQLHID